MRRNRHRWLLAALTGISIASFLPAPAAAQTAAEKIYADLAKLPPAERQKQLEEGARREGKLIYVRTLRAKLGHDHLELFRKRYPFVDVDDNDMGSQPASERLVQEETAGRHLTDILSLAVPDLDAILNRHLAAAYPTPATAAILPQYKNFIDPQHRWTPYYWSDFGISYNTNMLTPDKAPKSWDDLCKPEYRGQVSFDGPNIRFLVGMDTMMGEEKLKSWLQCIGKNKPIIQLGMPQRFKLMLAGDHAVQGQNFLYYCPAEKTKHPSAPCAMVLTAPVLGYAGGMVINRNAPHPYAAALLANWALSPESQHYLASMFRGPLTAKHPYLPPQTKLVTYGLTGKDTVDKVLAYWKRYVSDVNH
jgi:iron(III) transport system substrate-binding protein